MWLAKVAFDGSGRGSLLQDCYTVDAIWWPVVTPVSSRYALFTSELSPNNDLPLSPTRTIVVFEGVALTRKGGNKQ